jgi:mannose-6-phosphate isomerase-like protein (cupin superfamily)
MNATFEDSDRVLTSDILGMRMEIIKSAADSGGAVFESLTTVVPGFGGPPIHFHPKAEETFRVLSGTLDVCVGREWRQLTPGQSATVPAGVAHTLKNPSATETQFTTTYKPAYEIESFFKTMIALANKDKVTLPPKGLRSVMLASAYPGTNRSLSPPPISGLYRKTLRIQIAHLIVAPR